jgi:type I restriction enzyme M protein
VIDTLTQRFETAIAGLAELEEVHGGEDGAFADFEKINKATVAARLKEIKGEKDAADEVGILGKWLELNAQEADLKKRLKEAEAGLDAKACNQYPKLAEAEIKMLAVDAKWLAKLDGDIHGEMDRISQALAQRVRILAERYEVPMPALAGRVANLETKVDAYLKQMGFAW